MEDPTSSRHPTARSRSPRLGLQGPEQGFLGAQDLHGTGWVLGQVRQAACRPMGRRLPLEMGNDLVN